MAESFPFCKGSPLLISADNHNSVNGIEQYAAPKGAQTKRVPLTRDCLLDDLALRKLLASRKKSPSLFAYPAQSNLTGVQHSLGEWPSMHGTHASCCAASDGCPLHCCHRCRPAALGFPSMNRKAMWRITASSKLSWKALSCTGTGRALCLI